MSATGELTVRCSACGSALVYKREGSEIVAIHNCSDAYRRGWNAAFAEVAISIPCDAGSIYKSELWYEKHQQAIAAARREERERCAIVAACFDKRAAAEIRALDGAQ